MTLYEGLWVLMSYYYARTVTHAMIHVSDPHIEVMRSLCFKSLFSIGQQIRGPGVLHDGVVVAIEPAGVPLIAV